MLELRSVFTREVRPFAAVAFVIAVLSMSAARTNAGPGDIVLYASDVTTIRGTWERVSSTSGAGGLLMRSPDAGVRINTPLAAPTNYFEASFDAPANTAYHIWLRLRATNNSYSNDSVSVQLSDALNTSGSPVWRIGTTSALVVTLEACSGCGVSGWGWADASWWTGDYPVVKFSASGKHTVRLQTREDGLQIDQIVLSPTTYFSAAPGALKDDTTVVPKGASTTTSLSEVVLYASDASRRAGNWSLQADSTAAFGKRNSSYDYGWASKSAPSPTPVDFVEWSFNAVAGVRYRTWLRLRAANDSWKNDSVWVQFNRSVDANGSPIYRVGTTSGLAVTLEDCAGCGVSGWGWQSRSYFRADTGDVYFAAGGTQTLRIQTREDGLNVDQIVLSPSKFVSSSPGALRNDTTLVNRDGTKAVIGTSGGTSTSYPKRLTFTASTDNNTLVLSYKLEVFKAGVNPATATPAGTLNLGKPPVVSGQITADIGATVQALASGSYFATVSAVGSAGSSRSAPSGIFSR
jgi:hypothetical protein